MIPFNKPYLSGNEIKYTSQAITSLQIASDGGFTKKCDHFFETNYHFRKTFLTTSCTDALEMCAILLNIQEGDEVIVPAYTFVSTANAFVLRRAKIIFADSCKDTPNIDADKIEKLITPKTKAIVVVHYAGIACDIEKIMSIAQKHSVFVVEDTAHAIHSFYKNKVLGSYGHLATISFHETKNINCGEGGVLIVNDEALVERAEIIRDKGTDRAKFLSGNVLSYNWVDVGSSYALSELNAAYLYAQLEKTETIHTKRINQWNSYYNNLELLKSKGVQLPFILNETKHNAHIFYIVCRSKTERDNLISALKNVKINTSFHYQALNKSPYFLKLNKEHVTCKQAERYTDCLLRLPLFFDLTERDINDVSNRITSFYNQLPN